MKLGSKSKRVDNEAKIEVIDTSRKRFLSTAFSALAAIPLSRARNNLDGAAELMSGKQRPVRKLYPLPFGAPSREKFFELCSACQLCVERCPSRVLRPARGEYGAEGVMRPVMDFEKGFCADGCTVCGEVCPTGAIVALTSDQREEAQVGVARFVSANCIAYAGGDCRVCEERCELSALRLRPEYSSPLPAREGDTHKRFPMRAHIDSALCSGCGACENGCPATPFKAIIVEGVE